MVDQTREALTPPRVEEQYRSPEKPDDIFNPLDFAKPSWESAVERFRDAGVTDVNPDDPKLFNAYKRAVDYFADMGLGGIDLVDAAFKSVVGAVVEEVPFQSDVEERRLERDLYSMPESLMGLGAVRRNVIGKSRQPEGPSEELLEYNRKVRVPANLLDRDRVEAADNILYRPDRFYRFIGEGGYKDFLDSGLIRARQNTKKAYEIPYFMEGKSSSRYGRGEGGRYLVEAIPENSWRSASGAAKDPYMGPENALTKGDRIRVFKRNDDGSFEVVFDNIGDVALIPNQTKFAEGGAVSMERQMNLFEEGGLGDDGARIDPVSGNEVPAGSMAKEVRDDIPAQLSEGEYVVPADVVRYYGVKFFEDLRSQAKEGLMGMERDGRIGGEPVGGPVDGEPLTPEEEMMLREMMGMAGGGMVPQQSNPEVMTQMTTQGYNPMEQQQMLYSVPKPVGNMRGFQEGGMAAPDYSQMFQAYMQPGGIFNYMQNQQGTTAQAQGPVVMEPYVNAEGTLLNVPMIDTNGDGKGDQIQAGYVLPEGFKPQAEVSTQPLTQTREDRDGGNGRDEGPEPNTDPANWANPNEFRNALNQGDFTKGLIGAVGMVAPPMAGAIERGYNNTMNNAAQELVDRLSDPNLSEALREEYSNLLDEYKDAGYTSGKKEKTNPLEGLVGDIVGGVKNALGNIFGTKETPKPTTRPETTPTRGDGGDRETAPRSPAPTPRPSSIGEGGDQDRGQPASGVSSSAPDIGAEVGRGVGQVDRGLAAGVEAKANERSSDLDETGRDARLNKGGLIEKPKTTTKKSPTRGKRGLGKK